MPIKDYSTDPDLNVRISGINIAEGCPPSGINNAIRQLMADVKVESEAQAEAITAASSALEAFADQQALVDAAQDTAIAGKLDKSGGTMTGKLEMKNALLFNRNDGGQYIANNYNNEAGSEIYLFARSHATLGGVILLRCFATDGSYKDLKIRPNGDFLWDEASVITSAGGTMTRTLYGNKNSSLVDFYHLSLSSIAGAGHGGYIDFHFNGSTEGFTSRIIEYDHILNLIASNGVWVNNSPVLTAISMPNYAAGVTVSSGFTAPSAGLYRHSGANVTGNTFVNGVHVDMYAWQSGNYAGHAGCTLLLSKGDVITYSGDVPNHRHFYPFKGV